MYQKLWKANPTGDGSCLENSRALIAPLEFDSLAFRHFIGDYCMSKQQEVIDRAYGNMPNEVGFKVDWEFIPTWRGVKYYWYKLVRKVTR